MKWEMEIEEFEAILVKISDLHDKLSDEIHLISRSHFLNSTKSSARSEKPRGCVFVKGFGLDGNDPAVQEAKSLNEIRTALENLEDSLESFHTVHTQQRAGRDVAIARLEHSRIVLAKKLAELNGGKYKVLEEASALVGNIETANQSVSPENLYCSILNPSGFKPIPSDGKRSNLLVIARTSSFGFVKRALQFNHVRGVMGNATIFAISMITMLHLRKKEDSLYRTPRKAYRRGPSSVDGWLDRLDVSMARG